MPAVKRARTSCLPAGMAARLRRHPGTALTPDEIDWLAEMGWLSPWEEGFLRNTAGQHAGNFARRRSLSDSQLAARHRINRRVLAWAKALGE